MSTSYHLSLDFKPQGRSKQDVKTVGQYIEEERYLENFDILDSSRHQMTLIVEEMKRYCTSLT